MTTAIARRLSQIDARPASRTAAIARRLPASAADRRRRRARPRAAAAPEARTARRCALSDIADSARAGAGEELVAGRARGQAERCMRCSTASTRSSTWAASRPRGRSSRSCRPTSSASTTSTKRRASTACKRIVFASSNHVTGFYRQDEVIDPRRCRCGPTATTASARRSARTWRASTSTATASRRCACASARRSPSRRTAACSPPG